MTEKFEMTEEMLAKVAAGYDPDTDPDAMWAVDRDVLSLAMWGKCLQEGYSGDDLITVINKSERFQMMMSRKGFSKKIENGEAMRVFKEEAAKLNIFPVE